MMVRWPFRVHPRGRRRTVGQARVEPEPQAAFDEPRIVPIEAAGEHVRDDRRTERIGAERAVDELTAGLTVNQCR